MYSYRSTYNFNRENFEKSKQTDGFKAWRRAQYAAQSGHCAWCYKEVPYQDMDVDHISPMGRAGLSNDVNSFDNLVLACHECNRDIKRDTAYNEVAYKATLNKLTKQQKQDGYAPQKQFWKRPEWIGPNRFCKIYDDFIPKDIPETERNVWQQESPLVQDYSLRISDFDYYKDVILDKISDNSDLIWKIVKWVLIILAIGIIAAYFAEVNRYSNNKSSSSKGYCDYECNEAARMKFEAEEEKKRQKEEEEYWEEGRRYWECRRNGGSDFDCG